MRPFSRPSVSVTPMFLLVLAALCFFDGAGLLFYVLVSSVLHEMGHACAAFICGGRVAALRLGAAGAYMRLSFSDEGTVFRELLLCLSGPAVSIIAAQAASMLASKLGEPRLFIFSGASLVLGLFNLLPLSRLDGGMALRALLSRHIGARALNTALFWVELTLSSALTLAGIFVFFRSGHNFTLLCAGAWCFISFAADRRLLPFPGVNVLSKDLY